MPSDQLCAQYLVHTRPLLGVERQHGLHQPAQLLAEAGREGGHLIEKAGWAPNRSRVGEGHLIEAGQEVRRAPNRNRVGRGRGVGGEKGT